MSLKEKKLKNKIEQIQEIIENSNGMTIGDLKDLTPKPLNCCYSSIVKGVLKLFNEGKIKRTGELFHYKYFGVKSKKKMDVKEIVKVDLNKISAPVITKYPFITNNLIDKLQNVRNDIDDLMKTASELIEKSEKYDEIAKIYRE